MAVQYSLFVTQPDWSPPRVADLPDLRGAKIVALDTETKDPHLKKEGPGWKRGDAYVAGVSIAVEGFATYLPLRHYTSNVDDPDQAVNWIRDLLKTDSLKLAANAHYDMDALHSLDVPINGLMWDVQTIDAVVDETHKSFSLEAIAQRRLNRGKQTNTLHQVLADQNLTMSNVADIDAGHVAEYAIEDAALLLDIQKSQLEDLNHLDLRRAAHREMKLTRTLWRMHQNGIRVDVHKVESVSRDLRLRAADYLKRAQDAVPRRFNPDSSKSLGGLLRDRGHAVPCTKAGNDSVTNEYLRTVQDQVLNDVYEYRRINKIRRDFVDGLFLRYLVGDRVYPQWFQSRNSHGGDSEDATGASTGRITGKKPNLTQIPSRDPELGPLVRSFAVAEEGEIYCKIDFSSQEPRITVHFAYLAKAADAAAVREQFLKDKRTDFHEYTRTLFEARSGMSLIRREAKDINLGLTYAMGKDKLAAKLNMDIGAAKNLFREYHNANPYIGETLEIASRQAKKNGFIRTAGGSIRLFNEWESGEWGDHDIFQTEEACLAAKGKAVRAKTHKALNSAVQGTAADQMKESLIQLDEAGILPLLQVYDETGLSVSTEKEGWEAAEIMENALPLEVPALAEPEFGPSWGETK